MIAVLSTAGLRMDPSGGGMDFTPLITVILALLVVRFILKIGLTWPVVVTVVFTGTGLAWAIQAWGVLFPSAAAFTAAAILTAPLHRRSRRGPAEA